MITQQDLQQAIAECQGQRNPNASTCIKLAAYLTIQRELFGEEKDAEPFPAYSFAPADQITANGDSEFCKLVNGRNQSEVIPVIDELMSTLQVIQPRLYDAVIGKIS